MRRKHDIDLGKGSGEPGDNYLKRMYRVLLGLGRWCLLILLLFLLLSGTSQLALMQEFQVAPVDLGTRLKVEYSLWEYLAFAPLKPGLILEVEKDMAAGEDFTGDLEPASSGGAFFQTNESVAVEEVNSIITPQYTNEQVEEETPGATPGISPVPSTTTAVYTPVPSVQPSASVGEEGAVDCSLLRQEDSYLSERVFTVRLHNGNESYPTLTRSELVWPDEGYGFHFVKFYFPYYDYFNHVYLNQNLYTSPVDSGPVQVVWPGDMPDVLWAARFVLDDAETISGQFAANLYFTFPSGETCTLQVGEESSRTQETLPPVETASHTPTSSSTPEASLTSTSSSTPASTATSTMTFLPTPDCSLLREVSHEHDDKVFYVTVRDDNGLYPDLVRSVTYWPDNTYDFHFVKNYFPYYDYHGAVYYEENQYTSPVDTGAVNVSWPADSRPSAVWAARFVLDDGNTISGSFSADLTFRFPSWGTCTIRVGD